MFSQNFFFWMLCPCSNKPIFSAHTESNPSCILLKAFAQFAGSRHLQLSYMFASSFQVYTLMSWSFYPILQYSSPFSPIYPCRLFRSLQNSAVLHSMFLHLLIVWPGKWQLPQRVPSPSSSITIFRPLSILPMNSAFSDFFNAVLLFSLWYLPFSVKHALNRQQNLILFIYSYGCGWSWCISWSTSAHVILFWFKKKRWMLIVCVVVIISKTSILLYLLKTELSLALNELP